MCLTRMTGEIKMRSEHVETLQVVNLALTRSSYTTIVPVYMMLHAGLFEFAVLAFDKFKSLNSASQSDLIFRRTICMDLLESTYRACFHFPEERETRMPGYTTYCRIDDLGKMFDTDMDGIDKAKITSEWTAAFKRLSRMVRSLFEYIKPSDFEFLAVLGLTFWNGESEADAVQKIAHEVRREIMKELCKYYADCGTTDYASRIGQLFCLVMNCQECAVNVMIDFQFCRLMNLFDSALKI
ncbi:hypothetical protein PMAYCL1PPCAC_15235, partial [Pristionchus mayeri]